MAMDHHTYTAPIDVFENWAEMAKWTNWALNVAVTTKKK